MSSKPALLLLSLVFVLPPAACSDDKGPAACSNPTAQQVRATEGDSLCATTINCTTSGQPDHQGCPNTCSCLCYQGACYQNTCTAIAGCTDPPVYR